jgi:hypothetical protein
MPKLMVLPESMTDAGDPPIDSIAVEFLSETASAPSAEKLLKASDGHQVSS